MKTIDGQTLKQMLISASNNVYNNYSAIDALNVFPVPDGDTGMNMNLTISSGAKEIANRPDNDVFSIMNAFSKGLLMGARGNSGVILSQIFRGISKSFKELTEFNSEQFANALSEGAALAYKAVMRPVEGTILTVARETAETIKEYVYKNEPTIEKTFKKLVTEANKSLNRTPDLLPILKEVGVVDSGAAGLVKVFEGMESVLSNKFIERNDKTDQHLEKTSANVEVKSTSSNTKKKKIAYNLSFTLNVNSNSGKRPFVESRFKSVLSTHGENIEFSNEEGIVNVKIETLSPGNIVSYAQNFGDFLAMDIKSQKGEDIVDLPVDIQPQEDFGMVVVSVGTGIDERFKQLGVKAIVSGGQTMNPSTEDIVNAINKCNSKTVYVFPNNSNIVMAATQAADLVNKKTRCLVVPTKTIPQGLTAVSQFNPDLDYSKNYDVMKKSLSHVISGSVTYAVKNTVIDGVKITKDYFMGLRNKEIIACEKDKIDALKDTLDSMVTEDSYLLTLILGSDITKNEQKQIQKMLDENYKDVEVDIIKGNQPVYSFLIGVE